MEIISYATGEIGNCIILCKQKSFNEISNMEYKILFDLTDYTDNNYFLVHTLSHPGTFIWDFPLPLYRRGKLLHLKKMYS